jgi:hypothetical protein
MLDPLLATRPGGTPPQANCSVMLRLKAKSAKLRLCSNQTIRAMHRSSSVTIHCFVDSCEQLWPVKGLCEEA